MYRVYVANHGAYGWAPLPEEALALAQRAFAQPLAPEQYQTYSESEWHAREMQNAIASSADIERSNGQNGYPYKERRMECDAMIAGLHVKIDAVRAANLRGESIATMSGLDEAFINARRAKAAEAAELLALEPGNIDPLLVGAPAPAVDPRDAQLLALQAAFDELRALVASRPSFDELRALVASRPA